VTLDDRYLFKFLGFEISFTCFGDFGISNLITCGDEFYPRFGDYYFYKGVTIEGAASDF